MAHYRLVEFKHKVLPPASKAAADAEWAVLHERYCRPTVETLRQLQGMYTKYGQVSVSCAIMMRVRPVAGHRASRTGTLVAARREACLCSAVCMVCALTPPPL